MHEFIEASRKKDLQEMQNEFGDLLFSLINFSRFVNINPEEALEMTNKKFIKRFKFLEDAIKSDGKQISELTLEEMDAYWEMAKLNYEL
jgi:XTP/dITP diphosphohydrolase